MLPLFIYILKAILVSGILLGYYWIGLRNTRFHYYNRFYLVGTVLLSLVLPLLDLQWFSFSTPESAPVQQVVQFIYQSEGVIPAQQGLTWDQILLLSLSLISAILLILFGVGVVKVYLLKTKAKVTVMERFDFIETVLDEAPFSFFRNLFWREDLPVQDETGQRMLKHELTHIEQYHSYDKLFVAFTTYLFWMNPFYWLIRKELEVVHEFIADEEAVAGEDAAVLAEMLLKVHYHSNSLSVGQSFFYSSIKRRIIMLTTSKKVSYSYARRILILPVAIGILVLLSFTIKDSLSDAQNKQMDQSAIATNKLDTVPAKYRDPKTGKIKGSFQIDIDGDMAIFKDVKTKKKLFEVPLNELGGYKPAEHIELILENTMTPVPPVPPVAPGKPVIIINGKEISSFELNSIDPSSIKTIEIREGKQGASSASAKIVRVDASGAKVESGKQVITIKVDSTNYIGGNVVIKTSDDPIVAMAEKDPRTITINAAEEKGKKVYTIVRTEKNATELPKDVLYVMDGKEISEKDMKDLSPNMIQSINVLKGEAAIKKYGDKAKNGVVEITTKK